MGGALIMRGVLNRQNRDRPIFRKVFKILTPLGFRWVGGTDLFRHGNPNLVRILKTVRIIGRSLTGR